MPWHHVIPKHEWKKRFGTLDGFNASDNLVNLSHENHTQLHKRYGEEGSAGDRIAADAMAGLIGKESLHSEASRLGGRHRKGVKNSLEHNQSISKTMSGILKRKVFCPHCFKTGGNPIMKRWHFDNCRLKGVLA